MQSKQKVNAEEVLRNLTRLLRAGGTQINFSANPLKGCIKIESASAAYDKRIADMLVDIQGMSV